MPGVVVAPRPCKAYKIRRKTRLDHYATAVKKVAEWYPGGVVVPIDGSPWVVFLIRKDAFARLERLNMLSVFTPRPTATAHANRIFPGTTHLR